MFVDAVGVGDYRCVSVYKGKGECVRGRACVCACAGGRGRERVGGRGRDEGEEGEEYQLN